MLKLLVVQPYLASYRGPFWAATKQSLLSAGVSCDLAVGVPDDEQQARQDHESSSELIEVPSRSLRLAGQTLRWQSSWRHWKGYDGLVVEASGSLLDTTLALLGSKPVGLWGHIDSYTGAGHPVDRQIERWQLRRAQSVLAYTARGAERALADGVDSDRVFTLNNTVDTARLASRARSISRDEADHLLGTAGWSRDETFCFIGGIDGPKRIAFLAAALDRIWDVRPSIKLLVAGEGSDASLLNRARERGQVYFVGRAGDELKAALGRVSAAILMPGRVGLVAVDSFALGLPIITTKYRFHAPEFEYLSPGFDSLVTPDSVEKYATSVVRLSHDSARIARLQEGALSKAGFPTMNNMVERFTAGCLRVFSG